MSTCVLTVDTNEISCRSLEADCVYGTVGSCRRGVCDHGW